MRYPLQQSSAFPGEWTILFSPPPPARELVDTTVMGISATAWLFQRHQKLRKRCSKLMKTTPNELPSDRDRLIGAWVLKSYHVDDSTTGTRLYPLGEDAKGVIVSISVHLLFWPQMSIIRPLFSFD